MSEPVQPEPAPHNLPVWFSEIQTHVRSIGAMLDALRDARISTTAWARIQSAFARLHEAADECDAALFAAGLERLK